ncbi:hypothetical protein [Leptospira wolffii]|uniref:hypothetical protein n=1 Tax=Leptospira wolffii TaxID=409998 RepID=UPI001FEF07D9|nr:hypothetical protein [Leptospira wolffii]
MYNLTNGQNLKHRGLVVPSTLLLLWAIPLILFPFLFRRADFGILAFCFFASLSSYFLFLKTQNSDSEFRFGLGAGILVRVLLLFSPVFLSEDVYRFLWDGSMVLRGSSPYSVLPGEIAFESQDPWREELLEKMNSGAYYSVYPPMLQILFLIPSALMELFSSVKIGIGFWKLTVFLFELGFAYLSLRKKNKNYSFLKYWLHPLVLWEGTGNGHPEPILVFFLFYSALLWQKGRILTAWISFLSAIFLKLVPLLLLPYLFFRWIGKRSIRTRILIILSGTVIFISSSVWILSLYPDTEILQKQWKEGLGVYFHLFEYHGGIYYLTKIPMKYTWYPYSAALLLSFLASVFIVFYSYLKSIRKESNDLISLAGLWVGVSGIYYALSSTVHPWYFLPILAASVYSKHIWPLAASSVWILSYSTYLELPYSDKNWALWTEHLIVLVIFLYETFAKKSGNSRIKKEDIANSVIEPS